MNTHRQLCVLSIILLAVLLLPTNVAAAKDEWLQVRSKNFNLIGNASDKEIRRVATKLEQYREVFSLVFNKLNFNSPIPTTVIVFKSDNSYKPYKPVKSSGKIDNFIAGYFMPGEDVNYVTVSTEGASGGRFNVIFHEYTHFIVGNNLGESRIPPWFNEGLAEYYETFTIEEDQKVTLGNLNNRHLALLQQNKLIPFDTFFKIDNYSLHEQGNDGVGLFYAQAWALMHYLIQGNGGARVTQLGKFLDLVMADKTPKEAFAEAFQTDYAMMEKELKKYVEQNTYRVTNVSFKNKLTFDAEMKTTPLSEAEAKAYLGDLLYHLNRLPEAEAHLSQALSLNPNLSSAQTSLGLVKLRQKDYAEAKKYLEKAVETDSSNYLAHYQYAYVLSREDMTDSGFVTNYNAEKAGKMRASLKKAIDLNPNFAESYNLYAFISVVRNEELDEAIKYLSKALKIAPGNQWYLIRFAELYLRRKNFADARKIAEKVAQTASERKIKLYAQNTLNRINTTEARLEEIKNYKNRPRNTAVVSDKGLTAEELAKLREKLMLESLNEALIKPKADEKRVLGFLTKIDCEPKGMIYFVKIQNQILRLRSTSFEAVNLMAYNVDMADAQIGCGAVKKEGLAVINYRPADDGKTKTAGEIVSIEFVPANFNLLN